MKKVLLTTVALSALGLMSPAFAADLPIYGKAPAVVTPAYDWSGFYIGAFGGYAFGNHNINNGTPTGFSNNIANYESHGPFGGGEIGGYWQSGTIVAGFAFDGAGTNINGNDNGTAGNPVLAQIDSSKLNWVASARAIGGIAVDHLLFYVDGGWAAGNITHTDVNPGVGTDTFKVNRNGLTAGGGIAYAMTNNLIGKIEYRYYDLGTFSRATPTNGVTPYSVSATYSTVLVGLDWKFGGGAVVAKY